VLDHVWRGRGALTVRSTIRPDESGGFRIEAVPAGPGWIVRRGSGRWDDPDSWTKVRAVDVPAGGRLEVDLR
jgi:hypothetical protein